MTSLVMLRPACDDDLAMLQKLTQDPETAGEFSWSGWYDLRRWRRRWDEDGLIGPDGGVLIVVCADEPVGMVSWRSRQTGAASHCWEMGIGLLPEARGHGYGTEAHRLLVRYLFAHTTAHRIEAHTEVENIAEQNALEKAGFVRDGVMRGSWWRDGAWRDQVFYSVLRPDLLFPGWLSGTGKEAQADSLIPRLIHPRTPASIGADDEWLSSPEDLRNGSRTVVLNPKKRKVGGSTPPPGHHF